MLWISYLRLPLDGLQEILTTALCLTDNESDTARRFISHEVKGIGIMILIGIDAGQA